LGIGNAEDAARDDHTWLRIGTEILEAELSSCSVSAGCSADKGV
jgi:hypothetical protein